MNLHVVHYAPGPSNSLFGTVGGMDENMRFQFQGQTSLFSERSSTERDTLILKADERVTRSVLTTAPLEDHNRRAHQKSEFMFEDAAPDTDQQLIAGKSQWIFNMEGEKYYLPTSRRHFPLSYRQSVTVPRKMKWAVA